MEEKLKEIDEMSSEEKVNDVGETDSEENTARKPTITKQQNVIYTIISICLFCLIYFGGKGVFGLINRPYYILQYPEDVSEQRFEQIYEKIGISREYDLELEEARIVKNENGYTFSVLLSGINDTENFADNAILFKYGNPEENIRTEIYPYRGNPMFAEYGYAVKYVNIDDPNSEILVFEYEDKNYVKYMNYGSVVPSDLKSLFSGCEKVY